MKMKRRNPKPDNIFLVPDSEAQTGERTKILDFGIAKRSQVSSVEKSRVCAADGKDWGSYASVSAAAPGSARLRKPFLAFPPR